MFGHFVDIVGLIRNKGQIYAFLKRAFKYGFCTSVHTIDVIARKLIEVYSSAYMLVIAWCVRVL